LPKKTLLLVSIFFLFIILTTAPLVTVKAAPACTVSVVFGNGLSTMTLNQDTDFNVSVKITNSPAIDFYSIKIQWDPTLVKLKDNDTSLDLLDGGFMIFAGPSAYGTHLAAGTLDDVAGYTLTGTSSGNGTLFKMLMHCMVPGNSTIQIVSPNIDTYIMNGVNQLNIDSVVDGSLAVVIPEFSTSVLLTIFLVASTLAIAAATVSSRKRRVLSRI
jgi:hypothetical protein